MQTHPSAVQQIQPQALDINTLKQIIQQSPDDLNRWINYVTAAEKSGDAQIIRSAYEEILTEWPLLYGYWKKYAEFEGSSSFEKAKQIYERGVKSVTPSVDLWTHYCVYVAEKSQNLDEIRSLFERAVDTIGQDFLANMLWDKYIEFEISQEEWANVTKLYSRIVSSCTVRDLDRYYERFQQHAKSRPYTELLAPNEEKLLEEEFSKVFKGGDANQVKKDIILKWREEQYKKTAAELAKRRDFELKIQRPYFHTVAIDEPQLQNWRIYLDFEEKQGDDKRIIRLYEKCMVPCALYMEFWNKYVRGQKHIVETCADIFETKVVKGYTVNSSRPDPYIALAEFEEAHGNSNAALETFNELIQGVGKGHLESIIHFVNFYRRQNNLNAAVELLTKQKEFVDAKSLPFLYMQKAHFIRTIMKDPDGARSVYKEAVQKCPSDKSIWTAYALFELNLGGDKMEERVVAVYEEAYKNDDLSNEDKIEIMESYLDFALNHSTLKLLRDIQARIDQIKIKPSKKRPISELDTVDPSAKLPRTEGVQQQWYGYGPQYAQWYGYGHQQYGQQPTQQFNGTAQ